jgi:hypothetical protein
MVAHLNATGRIGPVHLPMVEHLYGLCEAMDAVTGRGASYALLAAQFDKTWERLATLPPPDTDDEVGADDYDVVVLHAVAPPAALERPA